MGPDNWDVWGVLCIFMVVPQVNPAVNCAVCNTSY
jgi:hypothetical protein